MDAFTGDPLSRRAVLNQDYFLSGNVSGTNTVFAARQTKARVDVSPGASVTFVQLSVPNVLIPSTIYFLSADRALSREYAVGSAPHLAPLPAPSGERRARTHPARVSLFGDPDTVPPKVPLSLCRRERVRVRVRLDCMDTAKPDHACQRSRSRRSRADHPAQPAAERGGDHR